MKVPMSSTELEILRRSAEGFSVQEIASELHVSQQIISRSQKDILTRTGEGSLIRALQAIAKRGFVLTEDRLH